MSHFPLDRAYLCECGLVGNNSKQCACGNSLGLLNLAKPLNRPTLSHEAKEIFRYFPSWKGKVA